MRADGSLVSGHRQLGNASVIAAVLILLAAMPLLLDAFWIQLLSLAGILAILTIGFNLTFGVAGQINLAMGGFFAIGAYTSALMSANTGLPLLATGLVGALIAGAFAYLIGWPTSRLRGLYLAMATVAVQLGITAFLVHARWLTNGPIGIVSIRRPVLFGYRLGSEQSYFYLIVGVGAVVYTSIRALLNSRTGRAFQAIREDEEAARSLGIPVARYKVGSFVIGALCASIAGTLYAHFNRFISPESFDIVRSIQVLTMAVVGGLGSTVGSIIGAVVVILVPEYFIGQLPEGVRNIGLFQSLIFGSAMLAVLIFAPGGMVGLFRSASDRFASWRDRLSRKSSDQLAVGTGTRQEIANEGPAATHVAHDTGAPDDI